MKKLCLAALPLALVLLCAFVGSNRKPGGDVVEIYWNGKQLLQQFVHAGNGTQAVRLRSFADGDKIDVLYSHCGQTGKGRVLTLRNERNEAVRELKFADAAGSRSLMRFSRKDLGKTAAQKLTLYYRSNELPKDKLLAVLSWSEGERLASR